VRVVSFKADEELVEWLDRVARERRVPRSQLIRDALAAYLARLDRRPYMTRRLRVY